MERLLLLVFLVGCGPTSSAESPATTGEESADHEETEAETVEQEAVDAEGEDASPIACVDRSQAHCASGDGCVLAPGGCREATHECEHIALDRRPTTPAFGRGDPCERENAACAFDGRTGLCAPFVAVPSCPPTAEAAAELTVQCDHSQQSELRCSYPGTECACRRTPYCGGAAPPPEVQYPPAHFSCVPDFDDRGCPSRPVREGTRCQVDASVQCHVGCYSVYTCERGRWRHRQLPPRP